LSKRVRPAGARREEPARSAGPGPALGLLEVESIARGMVAADAVVKRAPVSLLRAEPTTPGKYLVLFRGGVAEVEEALAAGKEVAATALLDVLFLPQAARGLLEALLDRFDERRGESYGIFEAHTVAATLLAADTALKRAEVWLKRLHLARNIGGKGFFTVTGALDMVQAALDGASTAVPPGSLLSTELVEAPHPDTMGPVF
jgi:microcompartment protein CcmL/EutN